MEEEGASENRRAANDVPGRLIDELVAYIRARQRVETSEAEGPGTDERLLRAAIRQFRRHPLPTLLLAISIAWLVLAEDGDAMDEVEPGFARQIEDEIIGQVKGGYAYSRSRLRELIDRYPWAAGASIVAFGLGAALLLPDRRRRTRSGYVQTELQEEPIPGGDLNFDSSDKDRGGL